MSGRTAGYVTALSNGVGINLLLVGIGAVYLWLDDHLTDRPITHGRRFGLR